MTKNTIEIKPATLRPAKPKPELDNWSFDSTDWPTLEQQVALTVEEVVRASKN